MGHARALIGKTPEEFDEVTLNKIISGYPKFKLRDEPEIPDNKVIGTSTHLFYMFCVRFKFLSNFLSRLLIGFFNLLSIDPG